MRGNPGNLRRAAAAKSAAAQARAEDGLAQMLRRGDPITFRGLAQTAGVSLDFLYRTSEIRSRVEQLRARQQATPPPPAQAPGPDQPGSVIRTLTAQLAELKRQHRKEISTLRQALEAAHGENLELRRRLGHHDTAAPPSCPPSLTDASANVQPAQTPLPSSLTPDNQALDRSQPVLPMMPGMPERRTHDYARHGVTSLFAAFNIADGTVIGELHRRHRHQEFLKFLKKIDKSVPSERTELGRARCPGRGHPGDVPEHDRPLHAFALAAAHLVERSAHLVPITRSGRADRLHPGSASSQLHKPSTGRGRGSRFRR